MNGFSTLSVLVVDDCRHMRELTIALLRGFGFQRTHEADCAEAAWEILQGRQPDILIVDFDMPRESGAKLIARLRHRLPASAADMPILLMTAFSDMPRVLAARDAGASEILAKPLTIKGLLDRLIAAVDRPRPFVRATTYAGPDRRRRTDPAYDGPRRREGDRNELDLDSIKPRQAI